MICTPFTCVPTCLLQDGVASWSQADVAVQKGMPDSITGHFPAFMSRKQGVDKRLIAFSRALYGECCRPGALANIMREMCVGGGGGIFI